ncbi:hypothetical protein DCAR_0313035 [Daucus carota subsp. sativus]|uniref:Uncharacterized protein n=1 Tax=Daucus carota subsp. sativus TaxID=79200 RepID=A0A166BRG9_DAUCS|nr:hypothetical protein DCAR_0313035 [Daucus carota subsp. sativus]
MKSGPCSHWRYAVSESLTVGGCSMTNLKSRIGNNQHIRIRPGASQLGSEIGVMRRDETLAIEDDAKTLDIERSLLEVKVRQKRR